MNQYIALLSLLVRDYDEAIKYYTEKLGFELMEDTRLTDSKRWVVVRPIGKNSAALLLSKAENPRQLVAIGDQSGGRVFLFLYTDDFWRDYILLKKKGVIFIEEPRNEDYGTVVVFKDLYGNLWDLLEQMEPN